MKTRRAPSRRCRDARVYGTYNYGQAWHKVPPFPPSPDIKPETLKPASGQIFMSSWAYRQVSLGHLEVQKIVSPGKRQPVRTKPNIINVSNLGAFVVHDMSTAAESRYLHTSDGSPPTWIIVEPNLPLCYVAQDLCGIDPTQGTRARPCRLFGSHPAA